MKRSALVKPMAEPRTPVTRKSSRRRSVNSASGGHAVIVQTKIRGGAKVTYERPGSESDAHRVQVEAAKLRELTDAKLGKATPSWVTKLARQGWVITKG